MKPNEHPSLAITSYKLLTQTVYIHAIQILFRCFRFIIRESKKRFSSPIISRYYSMTKLEVKIKVQFDYPLHQPQVSAVDRRARGFRHREKFRKLLATIKLFCSGIIKRRDIFKSNWASAAMSLYRERKQREEGSELLQVFRNSFPP